MFLKIPLNTDLTNVSYRCRKETETAIYIEYNEGAMDESWEKISESEMREIAQEWFNIPTYSEPTQMDRIEAMLTAMASNTVTVDSISAAIEEGVNEV